MYQYTTPLVVLRFTKINFNDVYLFRVSIQNEDFYSTVKEYKAGDKDLDVGKHTIAVKLTQEETGEMTPGLVSIQVRALFNSGEVYASKPYNIAFKPVQDKTILVLEDTGK